MFRDDEQFVHSRPGLGPGFTRGFAGRRRASSRVQELYDIAGLPQPMESYDNVMALSNQTIAHELRNVFAVINACGLDLYDELYGRQAAVLAQEIIHAAARGLTATTDLMAVGQSPEIPERGTDVCAQVKELVPILRRLATPGVGVELICSDAPSFVQIDGTSVMQILTNLVANASDASLEHGTVKVECGQRAGTVEGDAPCVAFLTVTDQGVGIPAEDIERVFDRGFSTKSGAHCGLGLAVVRSVVERCNGWMGIRSTPGQGTKVSVEFPLLPSSSSGIALVVVADDTARSLLAQAFVDQGFEVLAAGDALEACDLIDRATVADIAVLDAASEADRGLWTIGRLHQVRRSVSAGSDGAADALPATREAAEALIRTCTSPTLQSPFDRPRSTGRSARDLL